MKRKIADDHALATMRAFNPASAPRLGRETDEAELERAMSRAIAIGERPSRPVPAGEWAANSYGEALGRGVRSIRRRAMTLAVGVGAALVAVVLLLNGTFAGGGGHPAYAAAAVQVAEANPRLLVSEAGWKVTDAGEFKPHEGETTFSNGSYKLTLNWYPSGLYRTYLRDRAQVSRAQRSKLLGGTATTVEYSRNEYATMLAPMGAVFVEVRGRLASRSEYQSVVGSLRPVGVDTWLAAMPASVVGPDTRAKTVEEMLRGVPLPPSFDAKALEREDPVLNHYALAVKVADTVSCAWVETWIAAKRAGDRPAGREAVDAMAGSQSWPLVLQMEREVKGGWAANIRKVAGELDRGYLNWGSAGSLVRPDGSGYESGPAWAMTLQCTSHYWRRPIQE
jgi:hypothetical protein